MLVFYLVRKLFSVFGGKILIFSLSLLIGAFILSIITSLFFFSWYSIIFFLVFIRGLLVLLFYVISLSFKPIPSRFKKFFFGFPLVSLIFLSKIFFSFKFIYRKKKVSYINLNLFKNYEAWFNCFQFCFLLYILWLIIKILFKSCIIFRPIF